MKPVTDFIEAWSVDDKGYWRIPDRQNDCTWEILFTRDPQGRPPWRFRKLGDTFWRYSTGEFLPQALINLDVPLHLVEGQLQSFALQQIVFGSLLLNKGYELFGPAIVDEAIKAQDDFVTALRNAIDGVFAPKKPSPTLTLVHSDE